MAASYRRKLRTKFTFTKQMLKSWNLPSTTLTLSRCLGCSLEPGRLIERRCLSLNYKSEAHLGMCSGITSVTTRWRPGGLGFLLGPLLS